MSRSVRKKKRKKKGIQHNPGAPVPGGQLIDFRPPVERRALSRNRKPGIL
jgi:hypothetical protein